MTIHVRTLVVWLAALICSAAPAGAQVIGLGSSPGTTGTATPGWTISPSLAFARVYDDNVLVQGPGTPLVHDYVNTVNPRGELDFNSPRSQFSAEYDGAFVGYQTLDTLNSYDQHAGLTMRRKLSKRSTLFVDGSATAAPTTEFLELTGVPFVRVGVFTDTVDVGLEHLVSKRMTITTTGSFQQARFDPNQTFAALLLGGNSFGGAVSLRERLSERTTFTVDGDVQHATIGTANDVFDIQHVMAGFDRALTSNLHVFASGGVSRLGVTAFGPPRTGPSWKLGLARNVRSTIVNLSFDRSYVPSFGFGGTMQNEDLTASIRMPITRRLYTQDSASWQRSDPLVVALPQLRSIWLQGTVGYAVRPAVHIEAFFVGVRQTVGLPDPLAHNQIGVQIVAGTPMRIR